MKQWPSFLLFLAFRLCFAEDKYGTNDGKITLSPVGSDAITTVGWKCGNDKVAEYDPTFGQTTEIYGGFKGRTELNTQTGSITISKLSPKDDGEYSVEINNVLSTTKFSLRVIDALNSVKIIRDGSKKNECVLICEAEPSSSKVPLNYLWTGAEDGQSKGQERQLSVDYNPRSYTCNASNPVSWKTDTAKAEEICKDPIPPGPIIGGLFGAVAIVGIAVVGVFLYREHFQGGTHNRPDDKETRNGSGSNGKEEKVVSNNESGVLMAESSS